MIALYLAHAAPFACLVNGQPLTCLEASSLSLLLQYVMHCHQTDLKGYSDDWRQHLVTTAIAVNMDQFIRIRIILTTSGHQVII